MSSLPQHPDAINITLSPYINTYEQKYYNIRSWLTTRKEDRLMKIKGIRDKIGRPQQWKWAAGTLRIGFTNTGGCKE